MVDLAALRAAIGAVEDPEIHRSLEELNMLREVDVSEDGSVRVLVALTIPGCPLKDKLTDEDRGPIQTALENAKKILEQADADAAQQVGREKLKIPGDIGLVRGVLLRGQWLRGDEAAVVGDTVGEGQPAEPARPLGQRPICLPC